MEACSCYDDLAVAVVVVVVVVAEMVLPSTCATTSCRVVVVARGHMLSASFYDGDVDIRRWGGDDDDGHDDGDMQSTR